MEKRTYIKDLQGKIGQNAVIKGWVANRRDHGKLVFFDIRDVTSSVQVVVLPKKIKEQEILKDVKFEWVVEIVGAVQERPKESVSEGDNGNIEILLESINVLNTSNVLPFDPMSKDSINEDVRLKYRYLDLRNPRMQNNIKKRSEATQFVRNYLTKEGFFEIETPLLTASTPEGARDYLVPARNREKSFYALPQSPQQFKQMLMVSGFEKYFQFARCMRDEDLRGDRQPEFTQMDMEMSFVEREDVMSTNEKLLIALVEVLYPDKKIQQIPFPRISYKEAMEKYGNDRPDIRKDKNDPNELAFCWVIDFPFFEWDDKAGRLTFSHNPFASPKPEFVEQLRAGNEPEKIISTQYDIVLNGFEIGGGSIRNHNPELLKKVLNILGYSDEKITENFGHMMEALSFGAPPHGGIAWGFDRLMMLLQGEPNIREVIAFPKNGEGIEVMTGAPSHVDENVLRDVGIKYIEKPKKSEK